MKPIHGLILVMFLGFSQVMVAQEEGQVGFWLAASTKSWLTLEAGCKIRMVQETPHTGTLMTSVRFPVLLWVQGVGWDTFEAKVGWLQEYKEGNIGDTPVSLGMEASLVFGAQNQNLGLFLPVGTEIKTILGLEFGSLSVALPISWSATWLGWYSPSDWVMSTFGGLTTQKAPQPGWVWWNLHTLRTGAEVAWSFQESGLLYLCLGWQGWPGSVLGGFDGMAVGEWPFFGTLGWRSSL